MGLLKRLEVPHDAEELPPTYLISRDVKPIEPGRRTWTWPAFFSLWGMIAFNASNWQLGSALLALGLNWWQCFISTLIGHIIAAVMVVIASYPGLYYHISFPVAMRMAWGFNGSIFVVLNRILLSIIWFGVQAWLGGLMTYVCLRAIWPSIDNIPNTFSPSIGMTVPQFVGFVVFFVVELPLLLLNPAQIRWLVILSTIVGFLVQFILMIWAVATMNSFGSVIHNTSTTGVSVGWMFMYGITTTISSITAGILSVCDFTRFAKTPRAGQWSQFAGFVPAWLANVFGIITVAATQQRFGSELWSVAELLVAIQDSHPTSGTRAAVFFCGFAFLICQFALNIAGNSFSGGTDMAALLPRWINIRRGQYLTAILGLAINPWYLLSGAVVFLSVMSSYSIFIQPFLGIIVANYFIVQKRRVKVAHLYRLGAQSIYWYDFGLNWRAVVAWLTGAAPHIPGFLQRVDAGVTVSKGATNIYYLCALTGFIFPFVVTLALARLFPVAVQQDFVAAGNVQDAQQECEEFIHSSEILRAVDSLPAEEVPEGGVVEHKFDKEE